MLYQVCFCRGGKVTFFNPQRKSKEKEYELDTRHICFVDARFAWQYSYFRREIPFCMWSSLGLCCLKKVNPYGRHPSRGSQKAP
jgi:hypothetical protein